MKRKYLKLISSALIASIFVSIFVPDNVDAAVVYNNDSNRTNYGSNYYGTSNLREWLNSDQTTVDYTHNAPTSGNVSSGQNAYANEKGFLSNLTESERGMIKPRLHKTIIAEIDSNVKDGGSVPHTYKNNPLNESVANYDSAYYKNFTDRVFLLSVKELNDWVYLRGWDHKARPTQQAVSNSEYTSTSLNANSYWHYWLRDSYATSSYTVRYVSSAGAVSNNSARNRYVGVRPALNLKSEISKSGGSGTTSAPATLGVDGETLNIGDYVTYGKYNNQPILWRVIQKDSQGTVLFSENILSIKPFDASGDGTYPELAKAYGETGEIEEPILPVEEVQNLSETHTETTITLTWDNPKDSGFDFVEVYQDDQIINGKITNGKLKIEVLSPNTTYVFKVVVVNTDGRKSVGSFITVKTNEMISEEVYDVSAKPSHDRVDLSWKLPASENFKHVNIYRDTLSQTFLDKLFGVSSVSAATKIFETNGTYFNDLTVLPETKYEYLLTTESMEGLESVGVSAVVTTPAKPEPQIVGSGYEEDPITGDYTYYWSDPTSGEVKVNVGGKHYNSVPAADKKIVIPKSDMKYTLMGDPDVSMIVIDDDGVESTPVKPPLKGVGNPTIGNVELPFSPQDLLSSGVGLLFVIGPIVLLALAFLLVPKLRRILMKALGSKKYDEKDSSRHFATDESRTKKGPRELVVRERKLREPRMKRERAVRAERMLRAPRERVLREREMRTERRSR